MRKSLVLTALFLLFSFIGFAQEWHGITSDSPTKMKKALVSSTENEIVVNVNIDGFYTQTVTTPNGKQVVVSVNKMASMLEAGAPDLPMEPISVIIGDQAEMTVNVVNSTYVDFENIEVAPSKGNFSRQINPDDVPYTYGEMYQQNAFWPATQAYLEKPYIMRDFRGQNIMVRPFAYNPVTKTLRVYTSMTIAMTKVSDNGENKKVARRSNTIKLDPEQKEQYTRRFINFGENGAKYTFDEDFGEMLIICADQYMSEMTEFVEWKNKSGRPTTLVSVTEAGGNNDNNIKSYIQNFYNDPNHNLEFILLVGEYNDLTPHSMNGGRSDNWFGMLEGSDYYLEALTGRFSVQNATQLQTHINKVLYYERDMQADVTWVDKGMGIGYYGAGSGHFGEDDYQHIDKIRDTLLHYTYSTVTEHHGGSGGDASVSTISGTTNDGISIINYCNHGSETSWGVANYSVSNVNALTNDYKLPIVWSVACLNGKFDVGECFGESWLRATNNSTGAPTGAIGGMFSWISQPWIPPMYGQDEMIDIFAEWKFTNQFNHTLGGASLNGAMYILDAAPSDNGQTQNTWLLFGDPSCMVRSTNPTAMNVTVNPSVLMLGMDALTVNANTDYAIATLSMNGEILASGLVIDGQCELTFPALSNIGNAELVVIGYNKVTYMGTIEVVPAEGAYVTINDYAMSGPANYGETIDMSVEVKNVGVETADNITVTLSTDNEYVTITSAESTVATLAAGNLAVAEGFQFEVASLIPDGAVAQFDVNMTSGDNVWTGKIMVNLHAPVIVLESLINTDQPATGNPYVTLTFKNAGSAAFSGGMFNIYSCSPLLDFEFDTMEFDDIVEPDGTVEIVAPYSFDPSVEPGSTFEIAYELVSGLYMCEGGYVISYGAIMEDFESGVFGPEWVLSAQNPWEIVAGGRGNYCAKSNNGGQHSSEGYMELSVNVLAPGDLTFWYKVSSESNYDKLHFYMDNQEKGTWSGTVAWSEFTQAVTAGQHTFKWSYTKDTSVSSGDDCAWIDNIKFPPTNILTFIDPATNLQASVEGMTVTLTWDGSADADSYAITRNGELVSTLAETTFSETVEEGNYMYSVFAIHNNQSSRPTTVMVVVNYDDVIENQDVTVNVYPNPANDMFTVTTGANNFEYQLINSLGQVVVNGNASGNAYIRVSDMNSGVYFLKVVANGNTNIQKVVIK